MEPREAAEEEEVALEVTTKEIDPMSPENPESQENLDQTTNLRDQLSQEVLRKKK